MIKHIDTLLVDTVKAGTVEWSPRSQRCYYEAECAPLSACKTTSIEAQSVRVMCADGVVRTAYLSGNHHYSYNEAEADAHREQAKQERERLIERNKMLKAIADYYKTLTDEELAEIIAELP